MYAHSQGAMNSLINIKSMDKTLTPARHQQHISAIRLVYGFHLLHGNDHHPNQVYFQFL